MTKSSLRLFNRGLTPVGFQSFLSTLLERLPTISEIYWWSSRSFLLRSGKDFAVFGRRAMLSMVVVKVVDLPLVIDLEAQTCSSWFEHCEASAGQALLGFQNGQALRTS